jgi:ketosteroid isomerase-like protein
MTNKELITTFYTAFANVNSDKMTACYHDDIVFEDPAFGTLKSENAKQMWRMLLTRNKEINITFNHVEANENKGSANWKAEYFYGAKKRKVINHISANFEFKDGKISKHIDTFSLWKWSKQALGFKGFLFGWTPFLKRKIQKQTNTLLKEFMKKNV